MIVAVIILLAVILGLLGLLLWGVHACATEHQTDHSKCIAHVASVTSNRIVALALREAAADYDSVDGEADLTRIRNTAWTNDESIPALWLRERADKIEAGQ